MEALLETLRGTVEQLRGAADRGLRDRGILGATDAELLAAVHLAGDVVRLVDALLIECAGEVARRSRSAERDDRLTSRMGCHDVSELLQRLTRMSPTTVARYQRAAKPVVVDQRLDGTAMPARFPAMRETLIDGQVGLDGLLAVLQPLDAMADRVPVDALLTADAMLAAAARGEAPDAAPPACADLLRIQAQAWAAVLDQDGAQPREDRAVQLRGVRLGRARDGVVPINGTLLPEVAAQFQRICDATLSPRVSFTPAAEQDLVVPDDRTRPQRQHDALATALFVAASSTSLPTIGGAAPTLVITVRAQDLAKGSGWAMAEGVDEPVTPASARHAGCAGVIQRVLLGGNGRILRLGTEERVFNRHQRRAIAVRDGGCIIPGCSVPAGWCEVHHVVDHAKGGPTNTDNGVLLCWFHHRFIDQGPWKIRMNHGVPEVQAPTWYDATGRWRAVTTSRTRMLDLVGRRT